MLIKNTKVVPRSGCKDVWNAFMCKGASTTDIGIHKIIDGTPSQYKTDGSEKATLLFRRYY